MTHIQQLTPLNKPHIHLHTLSHSKSLELYLDCNHITDQASKKDTALIQPDLQTGWEGRWRSYCHNAQEKIINNTYQWGGPAGISYQTKMPMSGPVSIATPGLAANHHTGNGQDHLHIVEYPKGHLIFSSWCSRHYLLSHVIQHVKYRTLIISRTHIVGGLVPLQRCSQCIVQPQPTGQHSVFVQ